MSIKIPLRTQLDLFAPAASPAEMSDDDRLKVVALLQSLLIEATVTPVATSLIQSAQETGDEQDHR